MILAYKGTSLASRIIRHYTRGDYSHVAWQTQQGTIIEAWHKPLLRGGGVREVPDMDTGHKPGTLCDLYTIAGLTHEQRTAIDALARETAGRGVHYDWGAILAFHSKTDRGRGDGKLICSEFVAWLFQSRAFQLLNAAPHKISPTVLTWSPILHKHATYVVGQGWQTTAIPH